MLTVEKLFKTKREEKGFSIAYVSEQTKISKQTLRALEQGNFKFFASEVYLKGFLKNYAKFLDMDIKHTLALYRREQRNRREAGTLDNLQTPLEKPKTIITPPRLIFIGAILIVGAVIAFIAGQVNKTMQPPYLEINEPVKGIAPDELYTEINSDTIAIVGKVEVGSKLMINGNEVTTNNLQEFRIDNFKLKNGSNEIYIVAESYYFSKTSQIKLTIVTNIEEDSLADNNPSAKPTETTTPDTPETPEDLNTSEKADSMEIVIEIGSEPVGVIITTDQQTQVTDTVEAGQILTFEAEEEFTIYSPRPEIITLLINNNPYFFDSQTVAIFKLKNGIVIQEDN